MGSWSAVATIGVADGCSCRRAVEEGGYKVAAQQHPTYEAVTVISGTAHIGMGDKLDEAKAKQLTAGEFVNLPVNIKHFAFAKGETVVQINSEGPFEIKYANPSDDPRKTN